MLFRGTCFFMNCFQHLIYKKEDKVSQKALSTTHSTDIVILTLNPEDYRACITRITFYLIH